MAGVVNGGWQKWVMGIGATIVGSLVINGIVFQRETRKEIAENHIKIERLEQRDENIIKYLEQFSKERMSNVDAAMARLREAYRGAGAATLMLYDKRWDKPDPVRDAFIAFLRTMPADQIYI